MVTCCLLLPGPDGTLDLWQHEGALNPIPLATMESATLSAMADWFQPRATEYPALAGVLLRVLDSSAVRVPQVIAAAMADECGRAESLPAAMRESFRVLDAALQQTAARRGGLLLSRVAEPYAAADGPRL